MQPKSNVSKDSYDILDVVRMFYELSSSTEKLLSNGQIYTSRSIHTFNTSAASPTDFVPASLAPSVIMTRNFFLLLDAHILQKNLFAASFKARSIRVVPMAS